MTALALRLMPLLEAGKRYMDACELHIIRAMSDEAAGRRNAALEHIGKALELSEKYRYDRLFADEGQRVLNLLKLYKNGGTVTAIGGNITITGGIVNATGGGDDNWGGAGIGCGDGWAVNINGGNIKISGGTVTCTTQAFCENCGESYGKLAAHIGEPCTICGPYQPAAYNETSGYYEISNADNLFWFAQQVNSGTITSHNAKLMTDIDLENRAWTPISNANAPYTGTFDGAGYAVKGFRLEAIGNHQGLFGYVKLGTVKNLTVYGEITVSDKATSAVEARGLIGTLSGCTVTNVHSYVDITCAKEAKHIGGVVGSVRGNETNTLTTVSSSSYRGTLNVGNNNECIGGVAGYANRFAKIEKCANYGIVSATNADAYLGGILGYVNSNDFTGLNNCLNVGMVSNTGGTAYTGVIIGWAISYTDGTITNNYYLNTSAAKGVGMDAKTDAFVTAKTADELKNGSVTFLLNDSDSSGIWKQTIGLHDYPGFEGADVYQNASTDPVTYYNNDYFSVTINWTSMEFNYVHDTWNPETLKYDAVGWAPIEGGGAVSLIWSKDVTIDLSDEKASLLFGNPQKSNQDMVVQVVIQEEILIQSGRLTPPVIG